MPRKKGYKGPSVFMLLTFGIITVCYFLAHVFDRSELIDLALKIDNSKDFNWLTQEGHIYRYFTHSFLHVNFLHYFMNMMNFILIWGILRKYKVNESAIIVVYCSSVVLGGFGHMLYNVNNPTSTFLMGASGGVFGQLGMLVSYYIKSRDLKSLKLTCMIDLPLNVIVPILVPRVSWMAHLIGFLIGLIVGLIVIQKKSIRELFITN